MCVRVTARCRLLLEMDVNGRHQMLLPDTHSQSLVSLLPVGRKDGGGAMEELLHPCAPVKPAVLDRS